MKALRLTQKSELIIPTLCKGDILFFSYSDLNSGTTCLHRRGDQS